MDAYAAFVELQSWNITLKYKRLLKGNIKMVTKAIKESANKGSVMRPIIKGFELVRSEEPFFEKVKFELKSR